MELLEQFGPEYPNLGAAVAKLRKVAANHTISAFKRIAVREHGLAVLKAINDKNRASLQRELPGRDVDCASETNHNTGAAILAALRKKARQTCNPDAIRKARSDAALISAYEWAMEDKRRRSAKPELKQAA